MMTTKTHGLSPVLACRLPLSRVIPLHHCREQGVEDEGEPAADESLAGTVVGAGRAAAGEHHREAEDQAADDRGEPRERRGLKSDDTEAVEQEQTDRMHSDEHDERGEPARVPGQGEIAEGSRDAETPSLEDESEDQSDEKSGDDHESALCS